MIQIKVIGGIIVIKVRLPKNRKNFDVEVFKIKTKISTKKLASTTIRSYISANRPANIISCGTSSDKTSHTFNVERDDFLFKQLGIVGVSDEDDDFDVDLEITALANVLHNQLKISTGPK